MANHPYLTNRSANVENGIFGVEMNISPTNQNQNVKLPKLPVLATSGHASSSSRFINNTDGVENKKNNNLLKSYESRKMSREGGDGTFS